MEYRALYIAARHLADLLAADSDQAVALRAREMRALLQSDDIDIVAISWSLFSLKQEARRGKEAQLAHSGH